MSIIFNLIYNYKKEKSAEETREFFEELISLFPTCGKYWKFYIEQEVR